MQMACDELSETIFIRQQHRNIDLAATKVGSADDRRLSHGNRRDRQPASGERRHDRNPRNRYLRSDRVTHENSFPQRRYPTRENDFQQHPAQRPQPQRPDNQAQQAPQQTRAWPPNRADIYGPAPPRAPVTTRDQYQSQGRGPRDNNLGQPRGNNNPQGRGNFSPRPFNPALAQYSAMSASSRRPAHQGPTGGRSAFPNEQGAATPAGANPVLADLASPLSTPWTRATTPTPTTTFP